METEIEKKIKEMLKISLGNGGFCFWGDQFIIKI
jgi:hypothetical protein